MNIKLKKICVTIIITMSSIALICIAIFKLQMFDIHHMIISGSPNIDEWSLNNEDMSISLIDKNAYMSFEVYRNSELIYTCNEKWRKWDLKEICILGNNNIKVISGDIGEVIYQYNRNENTYYILKDE